MNKKDIKQFLSDAKAVSPAIATLILIVVAAVAAAGIGILVSHSQGSSKEMLDTKTASVQGKILSDGSTTVLPVTLLAGPIFMADNPSYSISASGGGSDVGQEDVFNKKVDIGASSSRWSDSVKKVPGYSTDLPPRKDAIIQEGGQAATIWETKIGTGMIVIAGNLVSKTNGYPVTYINVTNSNPEGFTEDLNAKTANLNITFATLKNLYTVGSATVDTETVEAVQRSDVSGTEETFAAWIGLQDSSTKQLLDSVKATPEQGNQGIRDYISAYKVDKTKGVIGFVDIGFTAGQVNGANNVVAAVQNGTVANANTKGVGKAYDFDSMTSTGTGKGLARDLYYYSYGTPTGAVKAFLDFILSTQGQDAVHNAGFFSTT
jgi:ABC-type phosphate transport system substrate-binding protein